jgi:hypothetical protein
VKNRILKKIVPFDGKIFYRNPSGLKKSFFVFFWVKLVWSCWRNSVGDNKFLYKFCSLWRGFSLGWENSYLTVG